MFNVGDRVTLTRVTRKHYEGTIVSISSDDNQGITVSWDHDGTYDGYGIAELQEATQ